MKAQAYVFIDTENPGPKRIVGEVRKIAGVVRADALFGTPDVIAIAKLVTAKVAAKLAPRRKLLIFME
jgi:hypothetical protein